MAPVEVAIRRSATAVAKSTPGAIGNNETRSGEFLQGNDVVHRLFSRSALTGHRYSYSGLKGQILPSQ